MKQLQDTDKMPWGKYKDKLMQDVPASYFHYFWQEKGLKNDKQDPVADYIRRNIHAFQKENPDLLWG